LVVEHIVVDVHIVVAEVAVVGKILVPLVVERIQFAVDVHILVVVVAEAAEVG